MKTVSELYAEWHDHASVIETMAESNRLDRIYVTAMRKAAAANPTVLTEHERLILDNCSYIAERGLRK